MRVEPFVCYRPSPVRAGEFASLPYDVFDREEAAAYVADHPTSFLAIDRPETSFPPDHDMYAPEVYAKAAELLRDRVADGTLLRDTTPCYYLYRLVQGDHAQVGVVAACALDDYAGGVIKRHELTHPEKELDRVRHIEATGCQTGPIYLAYQDDQTLEALVSAAMSASPLYGFTNEQDVRETVWRIARPAAVEAFRMMFSYVPCAYIADGHHRAASAARVCQEMRTKAGDQVTGANPYDYLLCVLFPESQLTIMPYHRMVADTNGLGEDELVAALEGEGFHVSARQDDPIMPERAGRFGMHAFGAWRELRFSASEPSEEDAPASDPVKSLDVSILQDHALAPILGVEGPRSEPRISFVGGLVSAVDVAEQAGADGIAFTLFPTSMREVMTVADAGLLMPPKSTWFEPKLSSGLFIRRIGDPATSLS